MISIYIVLTKHTTMPNFPKSSRTFLNGPSLYAGTPLFQKPKKSTKSAHSGLEDAEQDYQADLDAEKCAKCGKPKKGHDDSTHAFTTNPDDPDYEGGDDFDVKPM